jgi:hypothetical protein
VKRADVFVNVFMQGGIEWKRLTAWRTTVVSGCRGCTRTCCVTFFLLCCLHGVSSWTRSLDSVLTDSLVLSCPRDLPAREPPGAHRPDLSAGALSAAPGTGVSATEPACHGWTSPTRPLRMRQDRRLPRSWTAEMPGVAVLIRYATHNHRCGGVCVLCRGGHVLDTASLRVDVHPGQCRRPHPSSPPSWVPGSVPAGRSAPNQDPGRRQPVAKGP